jgi:hypothetical protein
VLLFGGSGPGGTPLGDLWAWDGRTWTLLAPAGGPAPRDGAVLVHDDRRGRTVLFGGRAGDGARGDTWEWDGARWHRMEAVGPAPRVHAGAAFDPARGVTTLFGGVGEGNRLYADTWTWDSAVWRLVDSAGPPGTAPNGMTYDPVERRLWLLVSTIGAPAPGEGFGSELFEWSGVAWRKSDVPPPSLEPIQPIAPTGDGGLLLFDGQAAATWAGSGGRWARLDAPGPSARSGHALAFDAARGRVVLFGGGDGTGRLADTWEWDGTQWSRTGTTMVR